MAMHTAHGEFSGKFMDAFVASECARDAGQIVVRGADFKSGLGKQRANGVLLPGPQFHD